MGAEAAARLGDEIAHGPGLVAMLAGAIVGAAIGAAVIAAATVTAPVVAAVIIGGSVAMGALSMKQLVKGFCSVFKLPEPPCGTLMRGSDNVFINDRPAVRAGIDMATPCTGLLNHPPLPMPVLVAEGSATVFINGQPIARLKDKLVCGAHISGGSHNVFIGGGTQGTGHTIYDLERWTELGFEALGLAALAGAGALAASAGLGAMVAFGALTVGFSAALEGAGQLGDRLGPGYRDLLQGIVGLGTLFAGPRVAHRSGVSSESQFGPLNRGPLADDIANTFRSGTYTKRVLSDDETMYRVISDDGNPNGRFWSTTEPKGPLQSVVDLALDQSWGNSATRIVRAKIPAGTTVYEGAAASQGGLIGGGNQVYIPQVKSEWIVQ